MKTKTPSASTRLGIALLVGISTIAVIGFTQKESGADYVAHEWGTFTSIQGADGVLLDWQPLHATDLPGFVYNWSRPGLKRISAGVFTKAGYIALQRMETPVIYFYADKPMTASVGVKFPQGIITEWFPQAREVGPSRRQPPALLAKADQWAQQTGLTPNFSFVREFGPAPFTNSLIRWTDLKIQPADADAGLESKLPTGTAASHYFAARETDAAFVRVAPLEKATPAAEYEKFLFYRGAGRFQTPLQVRIGANGLITAANTGTEPMRDLFALSVRDGRASFQYFDALTPASAHSFHMDPATAGQPVAEVMKAVREQLARSLVEQGLYRREAEAMVKTWEDSWFTESGVRVLYVLPRAWTDRILPIELDPHPRELVRVMVGRAELITPQMEQEIRDCITQFRDADELRRGNVVQRLKAMDLGRFAATAIQLAVGSSPDQDFRNAAWRLHQAATTPASSTTPNTRQAAGRTPAKGG